MDVDGGSIAVEGVHGGIAEVGMKKAKVADWRTSPAVPNEDCSLELPGVG